MPEPDDITEPQRALVLLCQWLSATTKAESDKRFKAYYEHLVPLLTRFCLLQYGFDEAQSAVALNEAVSDHVEKVLQRPVFAEELTAQLDQIQAIGNDQALKDRFMSWHGRVSDAVMQALTLQARQSELSAADLEQQARTINKLLAELVGSGARLLQICMEQQGLKLSCFKTSVSADGTAARDGSSDEAEQDESSLIDVDRISQLPAEIDAERALETATARSVDRLYWSLMDLDPHERRAALMKKRGLMDLERKGSPEAQEFFCCLGEVLYKLARLRVPMLGLLYRSVRTRAIDAARRADRTVSLDAIEEAREDDANTSGRSGGDPSGHHNTLATQSPVPDPEGKGQFKYVDDGGAASALEYLVWQIRQPVRDAQELLASARTEKAKQKRAERLLAAEARCDFHVEVFLLETEGHTQTEIAEKLETTRDKVRTALKHIDAAIGRVRDKPDPDDAQDTPDDGDIK